MRSPRNNPSPLDVFRKGDERRYVWCVTPLHVSYFQFIAENSALFMHVELNAWRDWACDAEVLYVAA